MRKIEFEIDIPYISNTKRIAIFSILAIILLLNIVFLQNDTSNISYAKPDSNAISLVVNLSIKIYNDNNQVKATTENVYKEDIIDTYDCSDNTCKVLDIKDKDVLIYDNAYFIYNYVDKHIAMLNIDNLEYQDMKFFSNNIIIKNNDKYALYSLNDNKYLSEFIYDGIYKEEGLYKNTSKYNQVLDIYKDNNITKTYKHCNSLNTNELYCSDHVDGTITPEEVDNQIDIVLSQYPDLDAKRLFLIKSGIETVGLPYLWGGGHTTLDNTLEVANTTWGSKMVYLSNGFKNQVAGNYYPAGLDCAGFVRWLYYIASGVDLYKDKVNVISGRNKDVTLIEHDQLLPGDLILDKDHVVIYLYKDAEGKDISVHASYDNLQVEISNYKRGNTYYRLNIWM